MEPVAGKPLHFDCQTPSGRVRFKPFYQVTGELYTTYVKTPGINCNDGETALRYFCPVWCSLSWERIKA